VEPHLQGVSRLIVLPAGRMAGVPVEALTDQLVVSYAPSGTLCAGPRLGRGPQRGVAGREPPRAARDAWRALAPADPAVAGAAPPPGGVPPVLLRGREHAPLPGTRREVAAIAALFDGPRLLLGPDASEQQLHALAARGELKGYQVLHLATHGEVDRARAAR